MTAHEAATEILKQLGGNKFLVMTGSKNLSFDKDYSLNMRLTRNKLSAQWLKIRLNGLDLYDFTFTKLVKNTLVTVKTVENVYNDQLQKVFTSNTGLYTHL